jgi:predicted nucleic acid-binding protein
MTPPRILLIDTCVLINLLASGEIKPILKAAAQRSLICSVVEKESIYLRADDPQDGLEMVNLQPLIEDGGLTVCDIETLEEEQLYVNYASVLDDGEAMSLAIALARGWNLATDERKARRLFLEAANKADLLTTTSTLIRDWSEAKKIASNRLKSVLLQIENRARYRPSSWDVNHRWWTDTCK